MFSSSPKPFCRTASAQVLSVLSMMHTTARADHKELSAKKALCRSRLKRWHDNYRTGIVLSYGRQLNCDESRDHYPRARALRTLLLLQAEPLKCALARRDTLCRTAEPAARPDVLMKPHAHTIVTFNETICTPLGTKW